jgi:predicted ribosome quality control (RQC) complex YloA/Tae2 family protein
VQKENRVEVMKAQLEEQQKRLEDMQEAARKQGYGNSVYDP